MRVRYGIALLTTSSLGETWNEASIERRNLFRR